MINALLYVLRGGIPGRFLPKSFGPWSTVHGTYRRWRNQHVWEHLNDRLRARVRRQEGQDCRPPACILDRQTVRSSDHGGTVGFDAAKKTKGRKRPLLGDTLGLVLGVFRTPASTPERAGARGLLGRVLPWPTWLRRLWVDGGDSGPEFGHWVRQYRRKLTVAVVKRSAEVQGFTVLPRRWVVERTFGWLMKQRRLVRDYEATEKSATAWVYIAMIRIRLRRLA